MLAIFYRSETHLKRFQLTSIGSIFAIWQSSAAVMCEAAVKHRVASRRRGSGVLEGSPWHPPFLSHFRAARSAFPCFPWLRPPQKSLKFHFFMNHEIHGMHESRQKRHECLFVCFVYFVVLQLLSQIPWGLSPEFFFRKNKRICSHLRCSRFWNGERR